MLHHTQFKIRIGQDPTPDQCQDMVGLYHEMQWIHSQLLMRSVSPPVCAVHQEGHTGKLIHAVLNLINPLAAVCSGCTKEISSDCCVFLT